ADGASIHYNYWSGNWGYAASHGCLGLTYADSFSVMPARGRAQSAVGACGDVRAPYTVVQIDTHPWLDLELAQTPQDHEVGLMYRTDLPPERGMLFVYT